MIEHDDVTVRGRARDHVAGPLDAGPLDFGGACHDVLAFLQGCSDLATWAVLRRAEDDWVVLAIEDRSYGIVEGAVLLRPESRGKSGNDDIEASAREALSHSLEVGAYCAAPITDGSGLPFGLLAGADPTARSDRDEDLAGLVALQARLLSTVLAVELRAVDQQRRAERAEQEAERDVLTRLTNRRGWERALIAEEERCVRYGHRAGVLLIDLDDLKSVNDSFGHAAGDQMLRDAGLALRRAARASDGVARIGGDEFAVLAIEAPSDAVARLVQRLETALLKAGIQASIGAAVSRPDLTLIEVQSLADAAMYAKKRERKRA